MTSLTSLIERIEAATEGSRELDCEICVAVGWFRRDPARNHYNFAFDYVDIRDPQHDRLPGHGGDQLVPHITTSMDAAFTLLPNGFTWAGGDLSEDNVPWCCITSDESGDDYACLSAATFCLALLAAILRARQTEER